MLYVLETRRNFQTSNRIKRDYGKIVLEKVIPFYLRGNIPMVSAKKGCEKVTKFLEKNFYVSLTIIM